ncbi:Serine/threonine-protein phosphatase 2A regulatory subunit A gamma isoform [Thalictrum thalictroides]|uniref:Serine/threonine-protein phosphatase 2A regulatory subunit A gamma isoform n=1 Tax=Thalictrum thalictroides TaxID=46969 RepID=A0A7J6WNC4_THATH|nr:Serine/threonine-protein phosphatase 2A regulatory subunit A gamma isoform [Thalictrum thalictroides]
MDMTKPSEDGWIILKPLEDDWIISIASKLGEEKTRKDLISLLTKENIEDVDGKKLIKNWLIQFLGSGYDTNGYDNFRLTLAQQLGQFVPYVGGAKYAHILLPPLEVLSTLVEKRHVREAAVDSLCIIGAQMDQIDLDQYFFPLAKVIETSFVGLIYRPNFFMWSDQQRLSKCFRDF